MRMNAKEKDFEDILFLYLIQMIWKLYPANAATSPAGTIFMFQLSTISIKKMKTLKMGKSPDNIQTWGSGLKG